MQNTPSWIEAGFSGVSPSEMFGLFPWAKAMDEAEHDPVYHAEGSPWVHTTMVVSALERNPDFQALPEDRQRILRMAAWLHDSAKPEATTIETCPETGRRMVRQPRHALLGAKKGYQALIDAGVDVHTARDVYALVAWHMRPLHIPDDKEATALRKILRYAEEAGGGNWRELILLSRSDQRGRICLTEDKEEILDLLELQIEEIGEPHGVDLLETVFPFENQTSRLKALKGNGSLFHMFQEPQGARMILMSGLPGSGKDTYLAQNHPDLPVVSLDAIRAEMKIAPTADQGKVRQAAMECARRYLRQGVDFAWNATCLNASTRDKVIQQALNYDARVSAVSIDVPLDEAIRRNRGRSAPLPDSVIEKLGSKREPILPGDVHDAMSVGLDGNALPLFGHGMEHSRHSLDYCDYEA